MLLVLRGPKSSQSFSRKIPLRSWAFSWQVSPGKRVGGGRRGEAILGMEKRKEEGERQRESELSWTGPGPSDSRDHNPVSTPCQAPSSHPCLLSMATLAFLDHLLLIHFATFLPLLWSLFPQTSLHDLGSLASFTSAQMSSPWGMTGALPQSSPSGFPLLSIHFPAWFSLMAFVTTWPPVFN